MAAKASDWRRMARDIIRDGARQVVSLHPGITRRDLRRWVSRYFYPFGARENHPYKVWLSELRRQIGTDDEEIVVGFSPEGVSCGWCYGNGCLMCFAHRQRFNALSEGEQLTLAALLRAVDKDPSVGPVLADWFGERGWYDEEARWRGVPTTQRSES